ncbi:MAG: hypothetical protein AAB935_01250 [Patescibacteria group bacterium]
MNFYEDNRMSGKSLEEGADISDSLKRDPDDESWPVFSCGDDEG